jgi:uncharacterized membrane protein
LSSPAEPAPRAPDPHVLPPGRPPRIAALDAARAVGVLAMVVGHTLDALLAPAVRATPLALAYWKARGLTAPLFLVVSGWAVTVAVARSGARGWAVPRGRLRRVLLLLAIGYGLRYPGWAQERFLAGDREIWAHFLAFDTLHTIGVALLVTALVLGLPWRAGTRAALLGALAVLAVLLGGEARLGAPAPTAEQLQALPQSLAAMAVVQVFGGSSPFPVFPWVAYFFAGSVVGLLAPPGRRGALAMGAAGLALVAATCWTGVGTRQPGDPLLVAFRVGVVVAVLGLLAAVPTGVARYAAPLGRSSLGVYAIHLPVVYGWSAFAGLSWRFGPTSVHPERGLSGPASLAAAVGVLVVSFALFRALAWTWDAALRWLRARQGAGAAT